MASNNKKKKSNNGDVWKLVLCVVAMAALITVIVIGGKGVFMDGKKAPEGVVETENSTTAAETQQEAVQETAPQPEPIDDSVKVYE